METQNSDGNITNKTIVIFLVKKSVEYEPDWLYWAEWIPANTN
jgi:hypothetical protein